MSDLRLTSNTPEIMQMQSRSAIKKRKSLLGIYRQSKGVNGFSGGKLFFFSTIETPNLETFLSSRRLRWIPLVVVSTFSEHSPRASVAAANVRSVWQFYLDFIFRFENSTRLGRARELSAQFGGPNSRVLRNTKRVLREYYQEGTTERTTKRLLRKSTTKRVLPRVLRGKRGFEIDQSIVF